MKVIDYKKEHFDDLLDGELSNGTQKYLYAKQYAGDLEHPGWSYTVIDNGHLIACVGISEMWQGMGEAWFVGSSQLNKKSRSFLRLAKSGIYEKVANEHGLRRVQAACLASWPTALRFAKFMGFQEEGLMKAYGQNGEDYIRVAWLNGSN